MSKLIQELLGQKCACGAQKSTKQTFCGTCYRSLPKAQQRALYQRVGEGYEEAYAAAKVTLVSKGRVR